MPLLEVDGKIIAQSIAIGRFVANEVGKCASLSIVPLTVSSAIDQMHYLGRRSFQLTVITCCPFFLLFMLD